MPGPRVGLLNVAGAMGAVSLPCSGIAPRRLIPTVQRMELRNEITINAPASAVWAALGERFMHVGEWAAPIASSCPVGDEHPGAGAVRACRIDGFGPVKPGTIQERLTSFDRERMSFEYEALAGMPPFIARAVNRWSVLPLDGGRSLVKIHATLTLKGPAVLLSCLLRWQLQAGGARVAGELKHFVEHGKPHPRKLAASSSAIR